MSEEYLPERDGGEGQGAEDVTAPFSFKLMIGLTVLYLGWRLIQGIVWLVEKLS
jgi:hypothetical protein